MKNAEYWIWMQSALGYASPKPIKILEHFETAEAFYMSGPSAWQATGLFMPREIKALQIITPDDGARVLEDCRRAGYTVITPEDEAYPVRLKRIANPPAVLYVWGTLPDIDGSVSICSVGTRRSTPDGNRIAQTLGYRLAEAGAVMISGGAVGIDSHSHIGALAAGGKNVLVMGCGLSHPYLMQMNRLREIIAKNGAVISEYQPYVESAAYTFPQRNRIMSALSLGAVVIEAPARSGALITVTHATEQGKDVFAVPASLTSKTSAGNNKILQDGAKPVYSPMDILGEYFYEYSHLLNMDNTGIPLAEDIIYLKGIPRDRLPDELYSQFVPETWERSDSPRAVMQKVAEPAAPYKKREPSAFKLPPAPERLSANSVKVYNCFTNKLMSLDILIENSGLDSAEILRALTRLELEGIVKPCPGNRYMFVE